MEAATESTTLRYEKRRQDVVIERLWQTTATRIYDYIYDIVCVVLNGRTVKNCARTHTRHGTAETRSDGHDMKTAGDSSE